MPKARSALALISMFLLAAATANAQSPAAIRQQVSRYLEPLVRSGAFSGVVLVARADTVLFEDAYGMANIEMGAPNRKDTRFRIHSITKQFTAAAIVLLAEQQKVGLDSSVRAYLPELPASWQPITILHLLTHTSGLPQLEGTWYAGFEQQAAASEIDNLLRVAPTFPQGPLAVAPGTTFGYNNFAYDLLACVIERAAAMRYPDAVRMLVFEPAGMQDAGFDTRAEVGGGMYVASAVVSRLASGYNGTADRLQSAFPQMFGSAGAGGMYATARDLYNYDRAINRNTLFSAATRRANLDRAFALNDSTSYGFGWFIRHPGRPTHILNHSGGNNGYNASYVRYPAERVAIIVLSNRGAAETVDIRKAIARMVLGPGRE